MVKCFPHTGRTHQIRVHLQFLGHPIVNDPIYNMEAWGPAKGKGGKIDKTDEELLKALVEEHNAKLSFDMLDISEEGLKLSTGSKDQDSSGSCTQTVEVTAITENSCGTEDSKSQEDSSQNSYSKPETSETGCEEASPSRTLDGDIEEKDPLCAECKIIRQDPSPKELVMYLHALRYKGAEFEYCSKMPDWALEDWEECQELKLWELQHFLFLLACQEESVCKDLHLCG